MNNKLGMGFHSDKSNKRLLQFSAVYCKTVTEQRDYSLFSKNQDVSVLKNAHSILVPHYEENIEGIGRGIIIIINNTK